MWTVFVEYRLRPERRDEFVREIPRIREKTAEIAVIRRHDFLASADQSGLVVESITAERIDEARKVLAVRGSEAECPCMPGSWTEGKRRVWLFENLESVRL